MSWWQIFLIGFAGGLAGGLVIHAGTLVVAWWASA